MSSEVVPVPTPEPVSLDQRSAILQKQIAWYISQGFRVVSQTNTTAQLVKPKSLSCLWVILFGITIIGLIIYLIVYLMSKDKQVYIEVDPNGQVIQHGYVIRMPSAPAVAATDTNTAKSSSTAKSNGLAMVLEILPGLFGLLGIGWLYTGNTKQGVGFLVGMLIWDAIAYWLFMRTGGAVCYGIVPLNIILIVISALSLSDHMNAHHDLPVPEAPGEHKPEEVETPKPKHELLGNTEPVCPYCNTALDKMPGRKKKCAGCGNYMYIRTRPGDKRRVVVTEQDAARIDEQWMIENGTYEAHLAGKQEFEKRQAELAARLGRQPADDDVHWSLHNEHLIEHAKRGDWGLYRNTRFEMAEILRREKKDRLALETYLEVSYLDANGPNNLGNISDPVIAREVPPFDPKMAFQAPGIVRQLRKLSESLGISQDELEGIFLQVSERTHQSMKLPVSPQKAWAALAQAFDEAKRV